MPTVYRHPFPWLAVKPDREYGLECIHERFELDFDCPPDHPYFQQQVKEVVYRAVELYTRAKKYRWRSELPVEIDLSDAQFELHQFGTVDSQAKASLSAADQGSLLLVHGRKAYVAKIWFEVPKIFTVEDYIAALPEGFVNSEDIPDHPGVAPITEIEVD